MPNLPKHKKKPWIKAKKQKPTGWGQDHAIYNSDRWRRLRLIQLNKEPLCEIHKERNEIVGATVVDHKIAIQDGGEAWNEDNLQSLCGPCHNRKSGKEKRTKTK